MSLLDNSELKVLFNKEDGKYKVLLYTCENVEGNYIRKRAVPLEFIHENGGVDALEIPTFEISTENLMNIFQENNQELIDLAIVENKEQIEKDIKKEVLNEIETLRQANLNLEQKVVDLVTQQGEIKRTAYLEAECRVLREDKEKLLDQIINK